MQTEDHITLITKIMEYKGINLLLVALSVAGGIAKNAKTYLDTGEFTIAKLFANILLAGFAGVMFAYAGSALNLPNNVLYIFAGIGGFMGHESIDYLYEKFVKTRV